MKSYSYIFFILILSFGCSLNENSKVEIVESYYNSRNEYDFGKLKMVLSDTIIEIEGADTMIYSTISYYEKFQWDSVFAPTYEIKSLEQVDNYIFVTIATKSKRFEYLENNPMISKHKISFKNDNIYQMETIDYVGVDWRMWQAKLDTLSQWIDNNHPELTSFAFNLTKKGGENYLKAIELYKESK